MSLLLLLFFVTSIVFLLKRVIYVFHWSVEIFGFRHTWNCSGELIGLCLYFSTLRYFDVSKVSEFSCTSNDASLICNLDEGSFIILSSEGIPAELLLDFTAMSYLMNHTFSWEWKREQGLDGEVMYYCDASNNKYNAIPVILTYASLLHYFKQKTINIESKNEHIHWGMDRCYCNGVRGSIMGHDACSDVPPK